MATWFYGKAKNTQNPTITYRIVGIYCKKKYSQITQFALKRNICNL